MLLLRPMEDTIRELCNQLLAERDEEKAQALAARLRAELHDYIEQLRTNLALFSPPEPTLTSGARGKRGRQAARDTKPAAAAPPPDSSS